MQSHAEVKPRFSDTLQERSIEQKVRFELSPSPRWCARQMLWICWTMKEANLLIWAKLIAVLLGLHKRAVVGLGLVLSIGCTSACLWLKRFNKQFNHNFRLLKVQRKFDFFLCAHAVVALPSQLIGFSSSSWTMLELNFPILSQLGRCISILSRKKSLKG